MLSTLFRVVAAWCSPAVTGAASAPKMPLVQVVKAYPEYLQKAKG
jgi:hypothetical protein